MVRCRWLRERFRRFSSKLKPRKTLLPISKTGNRCAGSLNWLPITFISHCFFWPLTRNLCGGDGQDIALTQNTTTGLALLYHGLPLREGDEILTTTHDHYVHHESIRLATGRCGATWRKIPLFDSYDSISPDEIAERIRKAIGPKTRAVGVTWVHSSSGVRLPIARIAETLADVNRSRDEKDRVLLIVDGVHGFGVEDPKITALGCDAFAADATRLRLAHTNGCSVRGAQASFGQSQRFGGGCVQ